MDNALPSRQNLFSCRHAWIMEKGEQDQQRLKFSSEEWVVHNKVYDLRSYMDKHPGGRAFLELTQGMDVTVLFESHHVDGPKVEAVLKKFYVRDCKPPPTAAGNGGHGGRRAKKITATTAASEQHQEEAPCEEDFSYKQGDFFQTFKRKAATALAGRAHGPTLGMRVIVWAVLLSWLASFVGCCLSSSYLPPLLAGFLLHVLIGIGHNGMHTGTTWWKYLMDLSLFSSKEWTISHCISHHHYPNTKVDFEIAAIEPFIFSLYSAQRNSPFLPLYFWFILSILGWYEWIARFLSVAVWRLQPLYWENLLPLVELAVLINCHCGGMRSGWRRWLVMHTVSSILMGMEAMPLHHSDHSWSDGKEPTQTRPVDYGVHQLVSTQDYSYAGLPLFAKVLFFPFNHHRLHHLLPGLDESRLPGLERVLVETCAEFGEEYRVYPWHELFLGCLRNWFDVGGHRRRREEGKGNGEKGGGKKKVTTTGGMKGSSGSLKSTKVQ